MDDTKTVNLGKGKEQWYGCSCSLPGWWQKLWCVFWNRNWAAPTKVTSNVSQQKAMYARTSVPRDTKVILAGSRRHLKEMAKVISDPFSKEVLSHLEIRFITGRFLATPPFPDSSSSQWYNLSICICPGNCNLSSWMGSKPHYSGHFHLQDQIAEMHSAYGCYLRPLRNVSWFGTQHLIYWLVFLTYGILYLHSNNFTGLNCT